MQETLYTIIGEHQSEALENRIILHTIFTICNITDVSNKLNKNISVISLDLTLSIWLCISLHKSIHMIKAAYTNNESKIKINGFLYDTLTIMQVCRGCLLSILLYIIATKVLAHFKCW